MTGVINTTAINANINGGAWAQDKRVQNHPELTLVMMNLMFYALSQSATTGSPYVDGEFFIPDALDLVNHLDESALAGLLAAGLVEQRDGDVGYISLWQTTPHAKIQADVDGKAAQAEARTAKRQKAEADRRAKEERNAQKRANGAERSQRFRDRNVVREDEHWLSERAAEDYGNVCRECGFVMDYLNGDGFCEPCVQKEARKNVDA